MIVRDPELQAQEEALEWQRQERALEEAARKREHEYRLTKMMLQTKENKKVWMAAVTAPVRIAAIICVTLLTIFKRSAPPGLTDLLREQ